MSWFPGFAQLHNIVLLMVYKQIKQNNHLYYNNHAF